MTGERPRLRDTELHDIDADARTLRDLSIGWEPCYTFKVDYRHPVIWTATPADGSPPVTAPTAAELRAKLRQAAPVDRRAV
jgi:hypothetical protein